MRVYVCVISLLPSTCMSQILKTDEILASSKIHVFFELNLRAAALINNLSHCMVLAMAAFAGTRADNSGHL